MSTSEAGGEVVVVARIPAKPGQAQQLAEAFASAAGAVHEQDAGCLLYAAHVGDDAVWVIEKWASAEHLDAHGSSEAMKGIGGAIGDLLGGAPEIHRLTAVPGGDPAKGAL